MIKAFVLVQTEVGKPAEVLAAVSAIPGVISADHVTGPYEAVVQIEAPTLDDLGRLIIARIQTVPHITRTTTLTVVNL